MDCESGTQSDTIGHKIGYKAMWMFGEWVRRGMENGLRERNLYKNPNGTGLRLRTFRRKKIKPAESGRIWGKYLQKQEKHYNVHRIRRSARYEDGGETLWTSWKKLLKRERPVVARTASNVDKLSPILITVGSSMQRETLSYRKIVQNNLNSSGRLANRHLIFFFSFVQMFSLVIAWKSRWKSR